VTIYVINNINQNQMCGVVLPETKLIIDKIELVVRKSLSLLAIIFFKNFMKYASFVSPVIN